MKAISLATFLASIFVLGISLLWFPDIMDIVSNWFPVGTPAWLLDFIAMLPYLALSIILIILCVKLFKRGKPKDFEGE